MKRIRTQKSEKGQSMLELAVGLVVLLIILSGVVDLGRLFFVYTGMRDASQEGVVYAIGDPTACEEIEARAVSLLNDSTDIQVNITINGAVCTSAAASDACSGKTVDVRVVDPDFSLSMPFIGMFLGRQSINLEAGVSGTILRPPCP